MVHRIKRCMQHGTLCLAFLTTIVVSGVQAQSPYISRVLEYRPAPGQFINDGAWGTPHKAKSLIGGLRGGISLGGYGGYIVVGFDHRIENDPNNPYGIDFTVFGNPLTTGTFVTWSEAGIVRVMRDDNGNGKPDDTWYELAGSDHVFPSSQHGYTITYTNPQRPVAARVPWADNDGQTGAVLTNKYHAQPYYPKRDSFPDIPQQSMSFTGTRIRAAVDHSDPSYIQSYRRGFGYADNALSGAGPVTVPDNPYTSAVEGGGGDAFDIDWAIDAAGNSVHLEGIDFIMIYTGINADAGWLGEVSTEIRGVVDVAANAAITGVLDQIVGTDLPPKMEVDDVTPVEAYAFYKGIPQDETVDITITPAALAEITDGMLQAKAIGSIAVRATLRRNPAIYDERTVKIVAPDNIEMINVARNLRLNSRTPLSAQVLDQDGDVLDGIRLTWRSTTPGVLNIVQDEGYWYAEGHALGTSWLVVETESKRPLKDSILVTVLPEASTREVYLTIKDAQGNIVPRRRIAVGNFNLTQYVDHPGQSYDIDQVADITAAHAIATLFANEAFVSDLRFRDDGPGDGKLYLWRVPKVEASSTTYGYGFGGTTAETLTQAWLVKINQYTYCNNLHTLRLRDGDEIVVYHVDNIAQAWEMTQMTIDKDTITIQESATIRVVWSQHSIDAQRQVATLASDAVQGETVVVNGQPAVQNGAAISTDELGRATLTFLNTGRQRIGAGNASLDLWVRSDVPVGIPEQHTKTLQVWPNPAVDQITIMGLPPGQPATWSIRDLSGRVLHQGILEGENIPVENLPAGIYVLTLTQGSNVHHHKVTKQ